MGPLVAFTASFSIAYAACGSFGDGIAGKTKAEGRVRDGIATWYATRAIAPGSRKTQRGAATSRGLAADVKRTPLYPAFWFVFEPNGPSSPPNLRRLTRNQLCPAQVVIHEASS